jgi:hypothetical protein
MLISADVMRFLLAACLIGLAGLALLSLRQRKLSTLEFIRWGLLAVLLPLIGPFLVISSRPGKKVIPPA